MNIIKKLAQAAERDIKRGNFAAAWEQIEAMLEHDPEYAHRAAERWAIRYDTHVTQPALLDVPTPPAPWE